MMSRAAAPDVLVVGAGVVGLTTAICLAEQGLAVLVRADRPPAGTTSAVAGAIWGPHLVEDSERTAGWRRETLGVLRDLATDPAMKDDGPRPVLADSPASEMGIQDQQASVPDAA